MGTPLKNLQGSIVAIVTPFDDKGSIDYKSFQGLLTFHLKNDTSAIVVCGTTGETPTLNNEEYNKLITFTVEKIKGKIPVIAGVGTNSTTTTLSNVEFAEEAGVDGLLIVGPYYNKPTPAGFYAHFSTIAQSTKLPIIVYNVPGRTGKNIPADIVLKLANDFTNIIGVKEASGDINQIMEIISLCPEGFKVYSGDDALAFSVVTAGGDGCISVVANEIPKEFSELISHALSGDLDSARALHYRYLELMNLNFIESNPTPVKTALNLMGMIEESFRLPLTVMEKEKKKILRNELIKLELL